MMNSQTAAGKQEIILEQACALRAAYPDLYEFLVQRDRLLQKTLRRIPDPADPEVLMARSDLERLVNKLKVLPPGVSALADECERVARSRPGAAQ
jgi:hypothetical protein